MILPPTNLPIRPTTDFAKESLFNVLSNQLEFSGLKVLDLFCGSGSISFEFSSRGSSRIVSVDSHFKCINFIKSESKRLALPAINPIKMDVFLYLERTVEKFDLIFSDPPYDLDQIPMIHKKVFDRKILNPNAILVIEHPKKVDLQNLEGFYDRRVYGNVNFSFFKSPEIF